MAKKMKTIVAKAQKIRAKLLAQFNREGTTITAFAEKHKVSKARMGLQLKKARKESADAKVSVAESALTVGLGGNF